MTKIGEFFCANQMCEFIQARSKASPVNSWNSRKLQFRFGKH